MNSAGILNLLRSVKGNPWMLAGEAAMVGMPRRTMAEQYQEEFDPSGRNIGITQGILDLLRIAAPINVEDMAEGTRPMEKMMTAELLAREMPDNPVSNYMLMDALADMQRERQQDLNLRRKYNANEQRWNEAYAGVERQARDINQAAADFARRRKSEGKPTSLQDLVEFRKQYRKGIDWQDYGKKIRGQPSLFQRNLKPYTIR